MIQFDIILTEREGNNGRVAVQVANSQNSAERIKRRLRGTVKKTTVRCTGALDRAEGVDFAGAGEIIH